MRAALGILMSLQLRALIQFEHENLQECQMLVIQQANRQEIFRNLFPTAKGEPVKTLETTKNLDSSIKTTEN